MVEREGETDSQQLVQHARTVWRIFTGEQAFIRVRGWGFEERSDALFV